MKQHNYQRKITFADTDAAGVVYFSNLLSICHEAYEDLLTNKLGIELKFFFQDQSTAIPIVHAEIDFYQPLFCGEVITLELQPKLMNYKLFEINYQVKKKESLVAKALTRHICIDPQTRQTKSLNQLFKDKFLGE